MKRIGLLAAILLLAIGCSNDADREIKELPEIRTVIKTVEMRELPRHATSPGRVTSRTDAMIAARAMGTITEISVKAGQTVRKGQSMATIDSADIRSRLQQASGAETQAQAAFVIAENNVARYRELYEKRACSKVELEQMEFQYEAARGALESARGAVQEAQSYLKYAAVTAPFDGVVVERLANVGDFASPGHPLFRLIDPGKMVFESTISDSLGEAVQVGHKATVLLDGYPDPVEGDVVEKSGGSDTYTHSLMVRIALPQLDGIRAGMYGTASFSLSPSPRVIIPRSWIVERGSLQFVYVAGENGRAQLRLVRSGKAMGEEVEIISGLSGGERIATSNLLKIHDGCKLEGTE